MQNYKYEILDNPLHGGRHISYSNSIRAAHKRMRPCMGGECRCGGPYIEKVDGSPWTREEMIEGEAVGLWLENYRYNSAR